MHDAQWFSRMAQRLKSAGSPVSLIPPGQAVPEGALLKTLHPYSWQLSVPAAEPGAKALLEVAAAFLAADEPGPATLSPCERFLRFLSLPENAAEAYSPADLGLRENDPRCVMLLKGADSQSGSLLAEETPVVAGEILIPYGEDSAVLVKNLKLSDEDEVAEYAQALVETMTQEVGLPLTIGIGTRRETVRELPASFREAVSAVQLGQTFHGSGGVYRYDRLLLERFLSEVPPETRARCGALLFSPSAERVMNDEMLDTARHFLENDLNVADTARQLYIHRNTLLYRLEKLEKATGLDLRRFDDAMTFRLLLLCRNAAQKEFL